VQSCHNVSPVALLLATLSPRERNACLLDFKRGRCGIRRTMLRPRTDHLSAWPVFTYKGPRLPVIRRAASPCGSAARVWPSVALESLASRRRESPCPSPLLRGCVFCCGSDTTTFYGAATVPFVTTRRTATIEHRDNVFTVTGAVNWKSPLSIAAVIDDTPTKIRQSAGGRLVRKIRSAPSQEMLRSDRVVGVCQLVVQKKQCCFEVKVCQLTAKY